MELFFPQNWLGKGLLCVAISQSLAQLCTVPKKIRSHFAPHLHSRTPATQRSMTESPGERRGVFQTFLKAGSLVPSESWMPSAAVVLRASTGPFWSCLGSWSSEIAPFPGVVSQVLSGRLIMLDCFHHIRNSVILEGTLDMDFVSFMKCFYEYYKHGVGHLSVTMPFLFRIALLLNEELILKSRACDGLL